MVSTRIMVLRTSSTTAFSSADSGSKDLNVARLSAICSGLDMPESTVITPGRDAAKRSAQDATDLSGRAGVSAFKALLDAEKIIDQNGKDGGQGFEISVLVNNAGFGTYGPFVDTPLECELDMVELNCVSLTGIAWLALSYMNKGSLLINTASLAAFMPLGNFSVYAAAKAYVLSFSVSLAAEVADRGIKVCALCPGSVSTEFAAVASNGARKEVLGGKSVQKTVAHCLKAARAGKKTALWALKWKATAFLSRFVGRCFVARFTYLKCPRPRKS